ncbi:MAG: serine hydrolase [Bacteroidota bacterium]
MMAIEDQWQPNWWLAWTVGALLGLVPLHSTAQSRKKLEKEIQKIIRFEPEVSVDRVLGYSIGILVGDSSYVFNYGFRDRIGGAAVDATTRFEIGGLSKVFTATLVEVLVAEELLHPDSSLHHYLPPICHNPALAQLRLIDLIGHRSGFPKTPPDFALHQTQLDNPYAHYRKTELLDYYRHYAPPAEQRAYHYSHLNYALLEVICELVTQQDFGSLMEEKLLGPLGLTQSSFGVEGNLAQGHRINGQAVAPWTFRAFAAAEGLKSSMQDLLRFIRLHLDGTELEWDSLLAGTREKITPTDYSKWVSAAGGWHVIERKRFPPTIAHTGSTSGCRAFAAFVPATRTAVVILTNSGESTGGLGYHLLRMLNHNWKIKKQK